jgi:hypothetical protein
MLQRTVLKIRWSKYITDKAGQLLLAEEEWLEQHKHPFQANSHKEGGSGGSSQWKGKTHRSGGGVSGSSNTKKERQMSQLWHLWPLAAGLQVSTDNFLC